MLGTYWEEQKALIAADRISKSAVHIDLHGRSMNHGWHDPRIRFKNAFCRECSSDSTPATVCKNFHALGTVLTRSLCITARTVRARSLWMQAISAMA